MQSHGAPQLVAELPQSVKNATASKYFGLSNVRYGSLADISERIRDVRFASESRHSPRRFPCSLSAIVSREPSAGWCDELKTSASYDPCIPMLAKAGIPRRAS